MVRDIGAEADKYGGYDRCRCGRAGDQDKGEHVERAEDHLCKGSRGKEDIVICE